MKRLWNIVRWHVLWLYYRVRGRLWEIEYDCPRCFSCGEPECCPASKCDRGAFCCGYYR